MGSVARCGVEGGRYVLLAASRLTDRAYAAGDSPAGATPLNDSPCPPGHNTPLPLERSPPASFKRLLGSALTSSGADRARRELQPHFLTAADMAEPARPRSSASITGMNSKSALSQRKRGSATAGIFEASSKFTTI